MHGGASTRHRRGDARGKSAPRDAGEGRRALALPHAAADLLPSHHAAAPPPVLKSHQPHRKKAQGASEVYVERSIK